MGKIPVLFFAAFLLNSVKASAQLGLRPSRDTVAAKRSIRILPQNFYSLQLGYFCKKEVQLQKSTALPLYFRLGSKAYVDDMERKPNAGKP